MLLLSVLLLSFLTRSPVNPKALVMFHLQSKKTQKWHSNTSRKMGLFWTSETFVLNLPTVKYAYCSFYFTCFLRISLQRSDTTDPPTNLKPRRPNPPVKTPKIRDPLATRTVVVSGLATDVDSKSLWKKFRKCNDVEKISQWPFKTESGEEDPSKAEILFLTPSAAQEAISHLHAHIFKGSLMSLVLKKRLESAPSKASRLIVRNLPWNVCCCLLISY